MLRRRMKSERGAAIVEFALVVPILFTLVFGIAEFGRAYFLQTSLSTAARQGARIMALTPGAAGATAGENAARNAASDFGIPVKPGDILTIAATPAIGCPPTGTVEVKAEIVITYTTTHILGIFPGPLTLHSKGVMRCNG